VQCRQTLAVPVGRIENDHERLAVHGHIPLIREIRHPPLGRLPPVLGIADQETFMIGDQ
jgi:hypothetical protein